MMHKDSVARLRLTPKTCKVEHLREALQCTVGDALRTGFTCVSTEEARIQPFLSIEHFLVPVTVDFPAAVQESVAYTPVTKPTATLTPRWKLMDYIPGVFTDVD